MMLTNLSRLRFNWSASRVLKTAPIEPTGDSPVIVSMVCSRDLLMYLLAIKSFYRALGRGRIVIINDGSLRTKEIELLDWHVKPSEYVLASDLDSPHCPKYLSWRKLFCIARYLPDSYTMQLDSDTLTLGDELPDVADCVATDTSFILGTWDDQESVSMQEASKAASDSDSQHVQMMAERAFGQLKNAETRRYIRGCSGFDGFAPGAFDMRFLESFSSEMYGAIGKKWDEWGSEQTTSNVIVANSERNLILPHPRYYNYWGVEKEAAFVHFVGSFRYHGGVYAKSARQVIEKLI